MDNILGWVGTVGLALLGSAAFLRMVRDLGSKVIDRSTKKDELIFREDESWGERMWLKMEDQTRTIQEMEKVIREKTKVEVQLGLQLELMQVRFDALKQENAVLHDKLDKLKSENGKMRVSMNNNAPSSSYSD